MNDYMYGWWLGSTHFEQTCTSQMASFLQIFRGKAKNSFETTTDMIHPMRLAKQYNDILYFIHKIHHAFCQLPRMRNHNSLFLDCPKADKTRAKLASAGL